MSPNVTKSKRDSSDDDSAGVKEESRQLAGNKRAAVNDDVPAEGEDMEAFNARKLEQRRAYNRKCAAKARKRSKDLISHLQSQVEDLTKDKTELQRSNDVMRAQLELLENQNRTLMMSQRQSMQGPQVGYGGPPPFFMGGFGGGGSGGGSGSGGGYPGANMQLLDALAAQGRLPGGGGAGGGSMQGQGGMPGGGAPSATPGSAAPGDGGKFFR